MNTWFLSSSGSGALSLTIKSMLLGIVPVVVAIGQLHGISLAENDLVEAVNNIFALVSLGGVVFGLLRKIYYSFK